MLIKIFHISNLLKKHEVAYIALIRDDWYIVPEL